MGRAHEVRKVAMQRTSLLKSKLYSKFGKEIYMAAKTGGPDPDSNLALKRVIDWRNSQSPLMCQTQHRKIKGRRRRLLPCPLQGFGPGGSTLIVECLINNINRTSVMSETASLKPVVSWDWLTASYICINSRLCSCQRH